MLRYCLFHSLSYQFLSADYYFIINICTETYNYATADYHSFSQSVNQAMHKVSARPCSAVRAHVPQFVSMRFNAHPCVF